MLRHSLILSLILLIISCSEEEVGIESDTDSNAETTEVVVEESLPEIAPYVVATQDADIFINSDKNSGTVTEAKAGDVFTLNEVSGDWYEIYMFSGEPRYLKQSVANDTTESPEIPASVVKACQEIVNAEDQAVSDTEQEFPNNIDKQIEHERILMDRYKMPIFQEYNIPPSHSSELTLECAQNL